MAGKFLSLEEAARMLGVSVDEVHRLVDRKVLFPMRDGATIKFKFEDVERAIADLADGSSQADDLALDLDMPIGGGTAAAADEDLLVLDDGLDTDSIFEGQQPAPKSPSATGGPGSAPAKSDSLSLGSDLLGGAGGGDLLLGPDLTHEPAESDDLELESIVGATSSPALDAPGSGAQGSGRLAGGSGIALGSGSLDLGLSGIGGGAAGGSGIALGSGVDLGSGVALGSGPSLGSGASQGAKGKGPGSGPLDSGVSLEVGAGGLLDEPGGSDAGASGLSSDDFELGGVASTEEESASVVIASDSEAGDSSFFGQTIGGQSSSSGFTEDSAIPSTGSSELLAFPGTVVEEMTFSVWQVVGLICCSLLLLFGGFIAYDLVRTIGSPESTRLANPVLDGLAQLFGWRS